MNTQVRLPRAPTEQICSESTKILARLELILEFRPWIKYTRLYHHRAFKQEPPFKVLFDCFALGASLGVLLDLLGSPAPSHLSVDVESFDFHLALVEREHFFASFIQRVHLLELQGKLSYGEVLRVEDMFDGSNIGFAKVLKTVHRVLSALQASYPGLFILPPDAELKRREAVEELLETERIHTSFLRTVLDSSAILSCSTKAMQSTLEMLVVNNTRLRRYHDHVLESLEKVVSSPWLEQWETIFSFDDTKTRTNIAATYRSLCDNYLSLYNFLHDQTDTLEPVLAGHAQILLHILSFLPFRVSDYCVQLQNVLSLSLPTSPEHPIGSYDSLCMVLTRMRDIADTMDEMSLQLRTMYSARTLKARAYHWSIANTGIDPSELGALLLDDQLVVDVSGLVYQVFLFESMLLCCLEGPSDLKQSKEEWEQERYLDIPRYPIRAWELGPALKRRTPLNLVHAIPTAGMQLLKLPDMYMFELEWLDQDVAHKLDFYPSCPAQYEQWCSVLQPFVSTTFDDQYSSIGAGETESEDEMMLSDDEDFGGRRRSHPRPWSLIARKGPHSESSSLRQQEPEETEVEIVLSPHMLPTLFKVISPSGGKDSIPPLSPSLFSRGGSDDMFPHLEMPPTPPPEGRLLDELDISLNLPDLTGQVKKTGRFAEAHGGYGDVWKAVWHSKSGHEATVAVKALRSRIDDPEMEEKMKKRLAHELDVWRKLNHPHILPLYGTTSDFGHYDSMVCPWMDNGSVSKYMERWGDILTMTDRLQLLCEVAEGLEYLHAFGIVHGDLTGSNILIDDQKCACLCDFGLSSIVAELQGASVNSTISGAVRWADACLFKREVGDYRVPVVTTWNDIYSFGSVTLEILSGRIPYHYLRSDVQVVMELHNGAKPRRPASSFVTDAQWKFIEKCWNDVPEKRPDVKEVSSDIQSLLRASLEFRRHSDPRS